MATGGVDVDDSRPMMAGSSLFEPDDIAADDSEAEIDGMDVNADTKVSNSDIYSENIDYRIGTV